MSHSPKSIHRSPARRVRIALVGALAVAATGAALVLPSGVAAAAPRLHGVGDLPPLTTYSYTGSTVQIPVPAGADAVSFVAIGGAGGQAGDGGATGGAGAQVAGYALVKSGDTVTLNVGQQGGAGKNTSAGQGGWGSDRNGGPSGDTADSSYGSGGGGGGATTVSLDGTPVAVAGGGGGAGAAGYGSGTDSYQLGGGEGGNAGSSAGAGQAGDPYYASHGPAGGSGGSQGSATGGTGSGGTTTKLPGGVNGSGGGGGAGVLGGAGGSAGSNDTKGSGGGGGGAGSSMAASTVYGPEISTAKASGNGSVEVMWLSGFHIAMPTPASTVTASSTPVAFTVTGTDFDNNPLGDVTKYVTLSSNIPSDVVTSSGVEMTDAGIHTITATWSGDPDVTATSTVTVSPAAPSQIVIQGNPGTMPAGIPLQLGAGLADQFGNVISDVTPKATFSSDVAGDVIAGNQITMNQVGPHKITATVPGYAPTSVTVTITASQARAAHNLRDPQDALPGAHPESGRR